MNSTTTSPNAKADRLKQDNAKAPATPSRLDQLQALLAAEAGASIADMMAATGWQGHSVRGAMAGALKKRGLVITSEKSDGVRRYRASAPA
jgi:hypothetical protein